MVQAAGYCAAKYALTGMVKCLAQEYKRFGIRFALMDVGEVDSTFRNDISMWVDRIKILSVDAAAEAAFLLRTSPATLISRIKSMEIPCGLNSFDQRFCLRT